MPNTSFEPPINADLTDAVTGKVSEVWRIFLRRLGEAVGALAPTTARYWTSTSDPSLSNEQNLGLLASGYLKITTAIGIATPSTVAGIPVADIAGLPTLASGVYTPTLFVGMNVAAATSFSAQYLRVGATVTVSGRVDVDPTSAATLTALGVSLPIPSALANANECAGAGVAPTVAVQIFGDAANGRATLQFTTSADVSNQAIYWTFSYRIL